MDNDTRVRLARAGIYKRQPLSRSLAVWPSAIKEAVRYYTYHNPSYVLSWVFGLGVPVLAGAYYLAANKGHIDWDARPANAVPMAYPFPSGGRQSTQGYED